MFSGTAPERHGQGPLPGPKLVSASDKASLSGRVGNDGTVGINVTNGSASGAVTGRLQARSGGGTWKVSALCSGRWTATRSTTRTAQAE